MRVFFFSSKRRHTKLDCELDSNVVLLRSDLRPDLVDVEAQLRILGADGVLLSGSGPTLLMLHEDVEEARSAEIGRASCRERAEVSVVVGVMKKDMACP